MKLLCDGLDIPLVLRMSYDPSSEVQEQMVISCETAAVEVLSELSEKYPQQIGDIIRLDPCRFMVYDSGVIRSTGIAPTR